MGIIKKNLRLIIHSMILVQVLILNACINTNQEEITSIKKSDHFAENVLNEEDERIIGKNTFLNKEDELVLTYDDRYTFDKEIKQIQTCFATSRKTGTKEADSDVLCMDLDNNRRVVACGCGDAEICFCDGTSLKVNVLPAPISLFLLIGQSNAEGRINDLNRAETYKREWIINPEGSVYSTYGVSDNRDGMNMYKEIAWYEDVDEVGSFNTQNYERFLPSSLTNNDKNDCYNCTNNLTDTRTACGKGGIDSALAYKWHLLTGDKVWIVNASRHGSSIKDWDPREKAQSNYFWAAVKLYSGAEAILDQEIEAGHYTLSHKGIYWWQGEADGHLNLLPTEYKEHFDRMHSSFYQQLDGRETRNLDRDMDFFGIIIPRASLLRPNEEEDYTLCGARMIQYYETLSKDYPYIYMASVLSDLWTDDESVKNYFLNKYTDESTFNEAFPMLAEHVSIPSTLNDVHETIHYTQLGYNEIGYDAAFNICCVLGLYDSKITEIQEVSFITDDGITVRNGQLINIPENGYQVLAVRILPTYLSKGVELEIPDNMDYSALGIHLKKGEQGTLFVHAKNEYASISFRK